MEATCARESAGRNPMTGILTGCATAAIEAGTLNRVAFMDNDVAAVRAGMNAGQPDTAAFAGGHVNQPTASLWKPTGRGRPRPVSS